MRILITFIIILFLSTSCSTQTEHKEKELPSYFCNENLEKYFAGNDSLPIININPNDSFGVIRDRVDSLYKTSTFPVFKLSVSIDSNYKFFFIKTFFWYYSPFIEPPPYCGGINFFEVRLNSAGKMLIEGELGDTQTVREQVYKNLTNNGKDPNYSDNPKRTITSFQWDKGVKPEFYNRTLKAIINGYTDVLKSTSLNNYKKPLCELSINEFDSLSLNIPFGLSLSYPETNPYKIIPPPPIEDEFLEDSE